MHALRADQDGKVSGKAQKKEMNGKLTNDFYSCFSSCSLSSCLSGGDPRSKVERWRGWMDGWMDGEWSALGATVVLPVAGVLTLVGVREAALLMSELTYCQGG